MKNNAKPPTPNDQKDDYGKPKTSSIRNRLLGKFVHKLFIYLTAGQQNCKAFFTATRFFHCDRKSLQIPSNNGNH